MFSCNIVLLLFLFIFVSLSSCSLILFLGVSCQAIVLSLPRCKCCQHSFSVWFILFAVKTDVMLSFGTTLLFRFCFFVFRVKLLLWIKLIVYTFEFDDRANYSVANVLIFRFNLLSLTSMFLNVIVFGTNNVAKAIMLLVLRNRWIEPSKSIATIILLNCSCTVHVYLSVWILHWKSSLIYPLLSHELNLPPDFFGTWNFKTKKNWQKLP